MLQGQIAFRACHTVGDVALAVKEALERIEEGNVIGYDSNDTGSFSFGVSDDGEEPRSAFDGTGMAPVEDDPTIRPTDDCSCGYPLVWVEGRWEHDAAPYLWGDDHDANAPEPTGPARDYWDREDGVTE